MPRDMYYGSKMVIFEHKENEIEGIYVSHINEILASTKVPNDNLIFIEDYANILKSLKDGKVLEIRKNRERTIAAIKEHSEYYKNNKKYDVKVEGKDFFEVLNELEEKLERNMTKPKIYQMLFNGVFNTKKY